MSAPSPNRERRGSHIQLVEPHLLSVQGTAHYGNVALAELDHLQDPATTSPDRAMTREAADWDRSTSPPDDDDIDSMLESEHGGCSDA